MADVQICAAEVHGSRYIDKHDNIAHYFLCRDSY